MLRERYVLVEEAERAAAFLEKKLAVGDYESIAGFLWTPLSFWTRTAFLAVAALLFYPGEAFINVAGVVLLVVVVGLEWWTRQPSGPRRQDGRPSE